MVDEPVSHSRFADDAVLGIPNLESGIYAVLVVLTQELTVELKNIVFQISLKHHHVGFFDLPPLEFSPSQKQIIQTY